jgi:hypothetical protein
MLCGTTQQMSKQIIMSILGSLAVSIGGYLASCGSNTSQGSSVVVAVPDGCFLIEPKQQLDLGTPMVNLKPGPNKFTFDCGGRQTTITKQIAPGQRAISFTNVEQR